jgi:hypothetical protein
MQGNKAATDEPDAVWGATAIGRVINRSARQTFHLLESGALPARKVGKSWVASRRKLRELVEGADEVAA